MSKQMKLIGRWLQVGALILLPAAMFLELGGYLGRTAGLAEMLKMLVFGICAFYMGRLLEAYGGPAK